ncbi:hypothetical protein ACH4SP_27495 [Streptomyces sp. NPDC021093]|uniref:hypothetical protein n=1 Tax=Streptomyces sp. NPDC021093 TaxID=3365112 RepID=UPI0037B16358
MTARYALAAGLHMVVEVILYVDRHATKPDLAYLRQVTASTYATGIARRASCPAVWRPSSRLAAPWMTR